MFAYINCPRSPTGYKWQMATPRTHDVMSTEQRSALMGRIRGKDTQPEMALRRAVWALGLRYRLHRKIGRIKPDMVFAGARVAVFVDGCFWHRCPLHGVMPKGNAAFWQTKLVGNVRRDAEANEALTADGWAVLRFWEHEVEGSAKACAMRIKRTVTRRLARQRGPAT